MRVTFSIDDEFSLKLSRMHDMAESIAKEAVYAGADIAANEVRASAERVLSGESTGDMMDSFGIAPIRSDENDVVDTSVGFDGYDRKGVANQLKARALESGTSKMKKRPFVRPAMRSAKPKIEKAMEEVVMTKTKQILK